MYWYLTRIVALQGERCRGEGRQGCELPSMGQVECSIEEPVPREEYRGGLKIAVLGAPGQECFYMA